MKPLKLTVYDFDGTLIKTDSFISFARFAVGTSGLALAILKALPWLLAWKAGIITSSKAKQRLFSALYKGKDTGWFSRKGKEFVEELEKEERSEICESLKDRLDRGERVAIATASIEEWVRPWAEKKGVQTVIATKAEKLDGRLTGRLSTPNCLGTEKLHRVEMVFGDLKNTTLTVYTDSTADLPLCDKAQEVIFVK